jgi:hypothetical protein
LSKQAETDCSNCNTFTKELNPGGKMSATPKKLKYFVDGQWLESKTSKYMECFNPSTGEVVALAPQCTQAEVNSAVESASKAFPAWAHAGNETGGSFSD